MAQKIRWNIFAGIIFSVLGMCLLNYYTLFLEEEDIELEKRCIKRLEEKNNNSNNNTTVVDAAPAATAAATNTINQM